MEETLKQEIINFLSYYKKPPNEPQTPLSTSIIFTQEIINLIRENGNSVGIQKILRFNSDKNIRFQYRCLDCKRTFTETIVKGRLNNCFGKKRIDRPSLCVDCIEKRNIEYNKKAREERLRGDLKKPVKTEQYFNIFLNPNKVWKKDIKNWRAISILQNELNDCDPEMLSERIKEMDYQDFLQTMYWRAISLRVKMRANWACKMCGDKAVDVHHPDYSIRGKELQNINKLVAVCRGCHETFHQH